LQRRFFTALFVCLSVAGQDATLFRNVRIFDGKGTSVSAPSNVLVRGNKIERISTSPIAAENAVVIDGNGRTLMPGIIDAHAHIMLATLPEMVMLTADIGFLTLVAAKEAEAMLLRGVTTVRDLAGPSFGLKEAIDRGVVPGPRIFPAGAGISQTSGHGDFRMPYETPRIIGGPLSHSEVMGAMIVADGPDEVRLRTREQLRKGATHIKLMAGGGVSSMYDPLDVTQYSVEEIRAAVEAAENWGTYVTVHAYTPRAIKIAIDAGVKCIDHGQLADEDSAKLIAEKGIWWSLQPFLEDEDSNPRNNPAAKLKALQMSKGTERAYELAKKYKTKIAWGTDTLFDPDGGRKQLRKLWKVSKWFTPGEALKIATGDNGELLRLSGPRYPYDGKLGVVEEGALADLILVNGDPVANFDLLLDHEKNFAVVMKDGKIYKGRPAAP
jgi:imidazolonepropionase-like amidohydrolase